MVRTGYTRLNDNIGRRIRHLNIKLKRESDTYMKAGIEDQIENLKSLRKEVQKAHKEGTDTTDYLYETELKMKSSGNLSTSDKDIKERVRKNFLDMADEVDDSYLDYSENDYLEFFDLVDDYKDLRGHYVGISGDDHDNAIILMEKLSEIKSLKKNMLSEDRLKMVDRIINNLETATGQVRRSFSEVDTLQGRLEFSKLGILQ